MNQSSVFFFFWSCIETEETLHEFKHHHWRICFTNMSKIKFRLHNSPINWPNFQCTWLLLIPDLVYGRSFFIDVLLRETLEERDYNFLSTCLFFLYSSDHNSDHWSTFRFMSTAVQLFWMDLILLYMQCNNL